MQEGVWLRQAFSAFHPEFAVGMKELEVALRICELHGDDLLPDTVEVFRGCVDYTDSYIKARNRLFPHAATGPMSTEGAPFEGDRAEVWYCPECRQAEAEWVGR